MGPAPSVHPVARFGQKPLVIDQRIRTTRDRLPALFWGRPHARIVIEASTESEWVAQHLETLGHEVIVADPNYGLMYGRRSRRVKTDRRDVAALAEACRHGIYRCAHRRSSRQRLVQWHLNVRRELLDARTRLISVVRDHSLAGLSDCRWRNGHVLDSTRRVGSPGVGE